MPINLLDSALRNWAAGQRGQQGEQEDWQHQLRMLVQSGVPMVRHSMHARVPVMRNVVLAGAAYLSWGPRTCRVGWLAQCGVLRVTGLQGVWHAGPAAVVAPWRAPVGSS